jgi:hypothetical protein
MPMAVSEGEVLELRAAFNALPPDHDNGLSELQTFAEAIGFIVHGARQRELDEVDAVETVLRVVDLCREDFRQARDILRSLGYAAVADLLTRLAHKARPKPGPRIRPAAPRSGAMRKLRFDGRPNH